MAISVHNKDNYYAGLLNAEQYALYSNCVDSLSRGGYSISGRISGSADPNEISIAISTAVIMGVPELFQVDQRVKTSIVGDRYTLTFGNKYAKEDLKEMQRKLDREIDRICAKIRTYKTDYDKIRRLNQYLCLRVEPVNSYDSKYSDAYAALIDRHARCEGFSKAAKLILDRLGIPCMIARGEAEAPDGTMIEHAWNIIYCDGVPYHFDFMWNAGMTVGDVPGMVYLFLTERDSYIEHHTSYVYPECIDDSKETWNVCNGMISYIPDIARVKTIPLGSNYIALIRFVEPQDADEVNRYALNWARNELGGDGFSMSQVASYRPNLRVLSLYFLNE